MFWIIIATIAILILATLYHIISRGPLFAIYHKDGLIETLGITYHTMHKNGRLVLKKKNYFNMLNIVANYKYNHKGIKIGRAHV